MALALALRPRPRLVQLKQPLENFLIAQQPRLEIRPPAIGSGHRPVEIAVRMVQPGRALIVKIGQRCC